MTSRRVRSLRVDDVAELQAIDLIAHGQAWSERTFTDDIDRSDRVHLVAEQNEEIVGHAAGWVDHSSYRITNVATSSAHTGQGHATTLLGALLDHALSTPTVTSIQLEVRPANRRAQRLYSRFGFVPVGIERDFYDRSDDQGSKDALVMAVVDVCSSEWRERVATLRTFDLEPQPSAGTAA